MSLFSIPTRSRWHAAGYIAERVGNLGATFLSGIIVLRSLGPASFSVYGMTISVALVSSAFSRLALDERFAFAYVNRTATQGLPSALILQRSIVGAALGLAAVLLFGGSLNTSGPWSAVAVVAVCVLEAFSVTEIQVQAESRFKLLSTVGMTRSLTGLVLRAALLLARRGTLEALLVVALIELVVFRLGLHWIYRRRHVDVEPVAGAGALADLRAFFGSFRIRGFLLASVLSMAYTRTELFFSAAGLDRDSLGTYLGAQRFVEVYAYLGNVFGSLLLGPIANLSERETGRFIVRSTVRLAGVSILFTLVNVTLGRALLPHVVGKKFPELPLTFAVLSLNVIPTYVGTPIGKFLMSRARTRLMIIGGAVAVAGTVACFLVLPSTLASLRPAVSMVVGNTMGCVVVLLGGWSVLRAPPEPAQAPASPLGA